MAVVVAASAVAVVTGAAGVASVAGAAAGSTLTVGWPAYPPGFDPQRVSWIDNSNSMEYATLVDFNTKGQIVPYLATSWKITDGGKVWTFQLRHDVTFPSGAKLTSSVVKQTFERALAKGTADAIVAAGFFGPMKAIKTPSPYTVQFVFSAPYAPFLTLLTTAYTAPLDPVTLKKLGLNFGNDPSGAGPFIYKGTVSGQSITYSRNPAFKWGPKYWLNSGAPYVQNLVFDTISDSETALLAYEKGQLQVLAQVQPQNVSALAHRAGTKLYSSESQGIIYLGFNCSRWPFNNPLVRKAVAMAIQRKPIIAAAFYGQATPVYAGLPPTIPGYSKQVDHLAAKTYAHNLKKARALLAKAGFKKGPGGVLEQKGKPFDVSLWATNQSIYEQTAQIISQQLAPLGIKTKIQIHDSASMDAGTSKGLDQMLVYDYGWIDPQILQFEFGASSLRMHYTTPKLQSELTKADEITNVAARMRAYAVIQKQLVRAEPWVPLLVQKQITAVQSISGFQVNNFDGGAELLNAVKVH